MRTEERKKTRTLQDKIILKLYARGFMDDDILNIYDKQGNNLCIGQLKKFIYPELNAQFQDYILNSNI